MTMTEVELSDAMGICVKVVTEKRVALGLKDGEDYVDMGSDGILYTEAGLDKIRAAFGLTLQDAAGRVEPSGDTGDAAAATPGLAGALESAETRDLVAPKVVFAKVLRAKPSEQTRNNRHFMAVVVDDNGVMTDRIENLYATRPEPNLKRGSLVKVLDVGEDGLVLDRAELRRRGESLR